MEEEIKEDVVVDVDDDPWVKQMEEKLASKPKKCQPSNPFTICKVPRDIRRVDDVAHNPLIVSIGPYHRGDQNLHYMEEVKWRNLIEFRDRLGKDFNKYLKAMKELEPRARACYSGNIDMKVDEFIEMMLLDGLFIIEFFSTSSDFLESLLPQFFIIEEEEPPIYTNRGTLCRFVRDLLLLENQLPFFVLKRLWSLIEQIEIPPEIPPPEGESQFDLWKRDCIVFLNFSLPFEHAWDLNLDRVISEEEEEEKKENPKMINEDGVHHLLHLVYLLLKPTSLGRKSESMEPTAKLPAAIKKMKTLSFLPPRCRDCFRSPSGQESQSTAKLPAVIQKILEKPRPLKVIPSAVELDEAGVVFKCVEAKSFLDVKFEYGTMKMPRLSMQDSTKSLLRNFVAYEQCFPYQGSHITSYCSFMDQLVNTSRDVEILKNSKIMENWLGSDEEVAPLFNDLGKGIFAFDFTESYLDELFEQVTEHTQKTWPKWRAKLKHDYFSNTWAIISFIAAAFVIFLTSVQAYYAAFT